MVKGRKSAVKLHERVPPDWYHRSIRQDHLQRYWHKRRFEEVGSLIEPTGGVILDIGCADGVFTKVIADKSKADKVIGIDVLRDSINWAKKHWKKNKKISFKHGDAHRLDFKDRSFNAVCALEVLEHVYEPEKVLTEIKRVLKKGGYAVLLVPSENSLFKIVWFLWHFYGRMVWKDTHIQSFRNNSLAVLCGGVGFQVEKNHKFLLGMLQVIKARKK